MKADLKVDFVKKIPKAPLNPVAATIVRKTSFNQFQKSVESKTPAAVSSTAALPPASSPDSKLPFDGSPIYNYRTEERVYAVQE